MYCFEFTRPIRRPIARITEGLTILLATVAKVFGSGQVLMMVIGGDKDETEIGVPLGGALAHLVQVHLYHLIEAVGATAYAYANRFL